MLFQYCLEKKDPRNSDFDEVKTKVAEAIKDQRAKEQLEQRAKDLVASLSGPDGTRLWARKGKATSLEESFKLGSSLGKAGVSEAIDDVIYGLKAGSLVRRRSRSRTSG